MVTVQLSSKRLVQFLIILGFNPIIFAQQRQGNIVEYFGKEKVDEINEGALLHVFRDGLVLNTRNNVFSSSTTPEDAVFGRYLLNASTGIGEGQTFDVDFTGAPMKWESLKVDSSNTFRDNRIRSGYLFLTYQSKSAQTVIFEASGHTRMLVNGYPHEGDHYDYGWTLIPVQLKKGKNEFILMGGRFNRIRARMILPSDPVQFTGRDMTLPDIRREDPAELMGAIRVMNTTSKAFTGGRIVCKTGELMMSTPVPAISAMNVLKVPFNLPFPNLEEGQEDVSFEIMLKNEKEKTISEYAVTLKVRSQYQHHKRTFLSEIDGSVQYFSVAPSTVKDQKNQAMFLSVHGASVEATNQARAYKQKDWGHIVAPTNRRAFGFAWEDWGRLDALEVLAEAEKIYETDRSRTYLTGHSMGGHGTWYLGATYPDRFAAIAPCAGYPDLLGYRNMFFERMLNMSDEELKQRGMSRAILDRMQGTEPTPVDLMVERAGNPSRTLKLIDNYNHFGIYVLHGEKDNVVPTEIARRMRKRLGEFHSDFTYYEYPNGTHWYGDHSMDWGPIFDLFKAREIKSGKEMEKFSFSTASPGVSSKSHFIQIWQQESPFEISRFDFLRESDKILLTTENTHLLGIDLAEMGLAEGQKLEIDGENIQIENTTAKIFVQKGEKGWEKKSESPSLKEKGPHRNGNFKDAFRNRMVFVYATGGTKAENEWYYKKALFDAETFWYRANGNVELIPDTEFQPEKYPDQNVIVYGNKDNHSAWEKLLKESPLQVENDKLTMGELVLSGSGWGTYFIVPRPDSDHASVGVITATGIPGMKAAYANHYMVNGTTFPDVLIFDEYLLERGSPSVKCAGFWGNDWSVESGDFVWK